MKMKELLFFACSIACVILVIGCPKPPDTHPTVYKPIDTNMCPDACAKMEALKCDEATSIDTGTPCSKVSDCTSDQFCAGVTCKISCEIFCRQSQATGVWLNPSCIARIVSCDEIDTVCYVGRTKN